jgi:hypothetical protein
MVSQLLGEEFINLTERFPMKVPLPAPGRTGNTLNIQKEREIIFGARKQAGHSILADPFQKKGSGLLIL